MAPWTESSSEVPTTTVRHHVRGTRESLLRTSILISEAISGPATSAFQTIYRHVPGESFHEAILELLSDAPAARLR